MDKIKVMCVDDSSLIRHFLSEIVNGQADMEMVATAPDPYVARKLIKEHNPDVLTLDIEMPRMNGIEFLEKIMRLRPMPVVMISSLTKKGSEATMKALELGAVDFVSKPEASSENKLRYYADDIAQKIRAASRSRVKRIRQESQKTEPDRFLTKLPATASRQLIAIGSSTGGTEAVREIISRFSKECPPIVITQHMPEGFTASFAERLNRLCEINVKEAEDGEVLLPGCAYIAPGFCHLYITKQGARWVAKHSDTPPINRHRPAVDILFESVAKHAGKHAIGILLTGMGKDGAQGMLKMKEAGAYTVAQDEETCIVFGMPKAAIDLGASTEVLPLNNIAEVVWDQLSSANKLMRI